MPISNGFATRNGWPVAVYRAADQARAAARFHEIETQHQHGEIDDPQLRQLRSALLDQLDYRFIGFLTEKLDIVDQWGVVQPRQLIYTDITRSGPGWERPQGFGPPSPGRPL